MDRIRQRTQYAALLLLAASWLPLTGCATQGTPRQSIEPTWTYHDTPDPLAYSDVWQRPGRVGEVQVVSVDTDLQR